MFFASILLSPSFAAAFHCVDPFGTRGPGENGSPCERAESLDADVGNGMKSGFPTHSPLKGERFEPSVPLESEWSTSRTNMSPEKADRAVSKSSVHLRGPTIRIRLAPARRLDQSLELSQRRDDFGLRRRRDLFADPAG